MRRHVRPHGWRECRPAIGTYAAMGDTLSLASDRVRIQAQTIVDQIWSELPESDQRNFHLFTCHDRRSEDVLASIERFSKLVGEATKDLKPF